MTIPTFLDAPVLIIGAGPYGIAAAQELWHRGIEPLVIGEPFETWHRHTLNVMAMRSDPRGSSIFSPDDRYDFPSFLARARAEDRVQAPAGEAERDAEDVVPISLYRDYLRSVEEAVPFRLIRGRVESLGRLRDGRFEAEARTLEEAGDGGNSGKVLRLSARAVILATGPGTHQHLPAALDDLPRESILHSWQVDGIERLENQRVLVLGGGQSSAETVDSLRRANRVTWALRRPPLFFREPLRVPTPLFKLMLAGSSWIFRLPPLLLRAISRAIFRTTVTPRLKAVWQDESVAKILADAEALGLRAETREGGRRVLHCAADGHDYDRLVSATGYRFTLAGLPFLSPDLVAALRQAGDPPKLTRRFASAVPGLFLAGGIAESTHGPAMRFVLGARHAARTLGRAVPEWLEAADDRPARGAGREPERDASRPSAA
ncbi:MAG: SidA/IucD/PvdA family monooxygenase [Acidobacteriota bacterium]